MLSPTNKSFNFLNGKSFNDNYLRILTLFALVTLIFSVCLYFSTNATVADSDSGFEYTNAQNVLQGKGLEHGPVVQQLLYALILGIFGPDYRSILVFQNILTTLLVLVTFRFIRRKINFSVAVIASLFFLLFPTFYWGNYSLKQYPLFLLFLMLAIYYFDRYMENKESRLMLFSAVFLGLATMTHLLSLPFVGFVLLYYLCSKLRDNALAFNEVTKFYLILLLTISPYLIWRIAVDGFSLDLLLTYPPRWQTIKYGRIINIEFWGMPPTFTLEYYRRFLELLVVWVFLPSLLLFLLFGIAKYKDKKLIFSWFLVLIAPYFVGRGVNVWFYTYPFMPLMVALAAQGFHTFSKLHNSRRIEILVIGIIIALSLTNFVYANTSFEQTMNRLSSGAQDAKEFNTMITEGSNILFRSRALSPLLPHKNVLQIQDLSEEDAISYLDWKSDEEVAKVFMKYNISYVIQYKNIRWEKDYYVWFKPVVGREPSHFYKIQESQYFEKVKEGNFYILYKFTVLQLQFKNCEL